MRYLKADDGCAQGSLLCNRCLLYVNVYHIIVRMQIHTVSILDLPVCLVVHSSVRGHLFHSLLVNYFLWIWRGHLRIYRGCNQNLGAWEDMQEWLTVADPTARSSYGDS